MRASLILSLVLHGLVLGMALIGFSAHSVVESPRPVSVDILTSAEFSTVKAGKLNAESEKAAPKQSQSTEKRADTVHSAAKPSPSETVSQKQAALPPPKPKTLPPGELTAQAAEDVPPETGSEVKQAKNTPLPHRSKQVEKPKPIREAAHTQERREQRNSAENEPKPRKNVRQRDDRIAELIGRPTRAAQGESDFDPRKISALLNRDPTAGDRPQHEGAREPWRRPSSFEEQSAGLTRDEPERFAHGAPEGRDTRITANEIDAFRAQISRCWTPPVGGLGGDAIIVKLRIVLNEDGSLDRQPEIANSFASPFFRPAADSAVRAVVQCQPYTMPPEKYGQWRDMLLTFDPSRMYGG